MTPCALGKPQLMKGSSWELETMCAILSPRKKPTDTWARVWVYGEWGFPEICEGDMVSELKGRKSAVGKAVGAATCLSKPLSL